MHPADRVRAVVLEPEGAVLVALDPRDRQVRHELLGDADRPGPGPPPPCGVANVLCVLMWTMSNPMSPGRQRPRIAFRFAPS